MLESKNLGFKHLAIVVLKPQSWGTFQGHRSELENLHAYF